MKTTTNNSLMQEELHQYNMELHYSIQTRNIDSIKNAMSSGAPYYFQTKNSEYNNTIHNLIYKDFSTLASLGYTEIVEFFMGKHAYKNNYIHAAALQGVISGKVEVVEFLVSQFLKRQIDINYNWGILLSNTVNDYKVKNSSTNDLPIVKILLKYGAYCSACAHPFLNKVVKNSNPETITYLLDYQNKLIKSHRDYLPPNDLTKLYHQLLRSAVKRNNAKILGIITDYAKIHIPTDKIDYIILQKKLIEQQPDVVEFANNLYIKDNSFLNRVKSIGKQHEEFQKFLQLVQLNQKLNTSLSAKPLLTKRAKI